MNIAHDDDSRESDAFPPAILALALLHDAALAVSRHGAV